MPFFVMDSKHAKSTLNECMISESLEIFPSLMALKNVQLNIFHNVFFGITGL